MRNEISESAAGITSAFQTKLGEFLTLSIFDQIGFIGSVIGILATSLFIIRKLIFLVQLMKYEFGIAYTAQQIDEWRRQIRTYIRFARNPNQMWAYGFIGAIDATIFIMIFLFINHALYFIPFVGILSGLVLLLAILKTIQASLMLAHYQDPVKYLDRVVHHVERRIQTISARARADRNAEFFEGIRLALVDLRQDLIDMEQSDSRGSIVKDITATENKQPNARQDERSS